VRSNKSFKLHRAYTSKPTQPKKDVLHSIPPSQVLTEVYFQMVCIVCSYVLTRTIFWTRPMHGRCNPVACCHGWGLRRPQRISNFAASSVFICCFPTGWSVQISLFTFPRELVQKLHPKKNCEKKISFNRFLKTFDTFLSQLKKQFATFSIVLRVFQWLVAINAKSFLSWLPLILHCQNEPQKQRLVQILEPLKMWLFKLLI
jgi:hypothetical protein